MEMQMVFLANKLSLRTSQELETAGTVASVMLYCCIKHFFFVLSHAKRHEPLDYNLQVPQGSWIS